MNPCQKLLHVLCSLDAIHLLQHSKDIDNQAIERCFFPEHIREFSKIKYLIISLQNHRVVWIGKNLKDHLVPTPSIAGGNSTIVYSTLPRVEVHFTCLVPRIASSMPFVHGNWATC